MDDEPFSMAPETAGEAAAPVEESSPGAEDFSLDDLDTAGFDDFSLPDDIPAVPDESAVHEEPVPAEVSFDTPPGEDDPGLGSLDDLPSFDGGLPAWDMDESDGLNTPDASAGKIGDEISLDDITPRDAFSMNDGDVAESSPLSFEDDFGDFPGTGFDAEPKKEESFNDSSPVDDFVISGFSDFNDPVQGKRSGGGAPEKGETLPSEFTQEQYDSFLKNLDSYPLNLRIAIAQMISGDDFNEETIAALVHEVIQRPSAKVLANKLGKTLDRIIDIPRDFEKRSAAEYEASKTTLSYRLINQILPAALIAVFSFALIILIAFLTNKFIYRPLRAESLYKEGYALLEDEHYSQSLIKFNEADLYKSKKRWYFAFARGYREKRQYGMAEQMYERLLFRFNNDKTAGLEYARMELEDLLNYERAEEIVKRRVLDHYINDRDGMLLLGDIYMEWAGERDPSKYESARSTYATLMQLYGTTDLYMSRMMRYFIRTDNLREVLPLKDRFYGKKKNALEPADMVELSGYLLDKLYGPPGVRDDSLAPYIQDVRSMLEQALLAGPSIPEAGYNMGRYFVYTHNGTAAKELFEFVLPVFDAVPTMSSARVIRNIDTYRLLGEIYTDDLDYIKAEETYVAGIRLFEREKNRIPGDQRIGHLFADLADLDYFISGDLDQAFMNYSRAVEEAWDIPSVRYKMGYVQYHNRNYGDALGSFIKTVAEKPSDENALFALANTLYNRGDYYAAQGYYERLIELLDSQRTRYNVFLPQIRADHGILVEHYMYATNNLGVVQYRIADQTGDSRRRANAQVNFSESVRAWDALTRNPETLVRVDGTNLAAQNIRYASQPLPEFEPEIYGRLSPILYGESILHQNTGR
jgi:tetratricopeptide (TPR) repeat protein